MSHGLYDRCECGHYHPEHSLYGTCRGCLDCVADFGVTDEDVDHPYRPCSCRRFVLATEGGDDGDDGDGRDDGGITSTPAR